MAWGALKGLPMPMMRNGGGYTHMKAQEPITSRERLPELDVLRGIALFGIIIVNMFMFAAPVSYWQLAGIEMFTGTLDRIADFFIDTFARGKFLPIFAFLFGFGAALQWKRLTQRGLDDAAAAAVLRRRFTILLIIGVVHAILIWAGDILTVYAVFGLIVLAWRHWSTRRLLTISAAVWAVLAVFSLWTFVADFTSGSPQIEMSEMQRFFSDQAALALETYANGGFAAITAQRLFDYVMAIAFGWPSLLIPFSLLVVGFVAGRDGWWDTNGWLRADGRLAAWMRWTLVPGLISQALAGALRVGWWGDGAAGAASLGSLLYAIGAPLLAAGYIGAVFYLVGETTWRTRLESFGMVGRMSLTNYLLQSIIATLLVYSYGFGLYGQIGPAASLGIAAAIYVVQLMLSVIWLRSYRFGPVEWLWRSFTYGELQPMRQRSRRGA